MDTNLGLRLVTLGAFAGTFAVFTFLVGRALRSRGKVFLDHIFRERGEVADSVHFLLVLGFYLTCTSLLLWNLGTMPSGGSFDGLAALQSVALRLGIAIFAVAGFHTTNILVLSLLNRHDRG